MPAKVNGSKKSRKKSKTSKKKRSKVSPKRSKKKSAKSSKLKVSNSKPKVTKSKVAKSQKADFYINLQEKHFINVVAGTKTVEGRLNKGKFSDMKKGKTIIINGQYRTKIAKVVKYKTFAEFLKKETLPKTLPGVYDIDTGVAVYRQFYSETAEWEFGVVAIHLVKGVLIPPIFKKGAKKSKKKSKK